jgi:hypothetical protein
MFKNKHFNSIKDRDVEFSLSIDYESSIGLATIFAKEDIE